MSQQNTNQLFSACLLSSLLPVSPSALRLVSNERNRKELTHLRLLNSLQVMGRQLQTKVL